MDAISCGVEYVLATLAWLFVGFVMLWLVPMLLADDTYLEGWEIWWWGFSRLYGWITAIVIVIAGISWVVGKIICN